MSGPSFGLSTSVAQAHALTRDTLVEIARHGFEAVELVAVRSHIDYRDHATVTALGRWLGEAKLRLHAVHAPVAEAIRGDQWVVPFSNASSDEARRQTAVEETLAALALATHVPFDYLVVHMGLPARLAGPGDNVPRAAQRSIEAIVAAAEPLGVRVALELLPNPLSTADALYTLVDEVLEDLDVGVCFDYGHAHLGGDLGDALEALAGHIVTAHLSDNRGTRDDHLVPFAGGINWDAAMMTTQKVGYDGMLTFDVAGAEGLTETLQRAAKARRRLEELLVVF